MVRLHLPLDALQQALQLGLRLRQLSAQLARQRLGGGRLLGPARDVRLQGLFEFRFERGKAVSDEGHFRIRGGVPSLTQLQRRAGLGFGNCLSPLPPAPAPPSPLTLASLPSASFLAAAFLSLALRCFRSVRTWGWFWVLGDSRAVWRARAALSRLNTPAQEQGQLPAGWEV